MHVIDSGLVDQVWWLNSHCWVWCE